MISSLVDSGLVSSCFIRGLNKISFQISYFRLTGFALSSTEGADADADFVCERVCLAGTSKSSAASSSKITKYTIIYRFFGLFLIKLIKFGYNSKILSNLFFFSYTNK